MTYDNVCKRLEGYWEKPWNELPDEQQKAWRRTISTRLGEDYIERRWDLDDAVTRRKSAEWHDLRYDPTLCVDWFDKTINAKFWLKLASVKPAEAAMLMFCIDPLSDRSPEQVSVDGVKVSPKHYQLLLRAFIDEAEADGKSHKLADWREVARRKGLQYNQWIDRYVLASRQELPADPGSRHIALRVGAGKTAKHEWMTQAWSIGESWMLAEEKRSGKRPTVEQIAKHVEGDLSTRGITGPRGVFLDWETIKREVLTGITGRTKGDNFKTAKGNPQRKWGSPSR